MLSKTIYRKNDVRPLRNSTRGQLRSSKVKRIVQTAAIQRSLKNAHELPQLHRPKELQQGHQNTAHVCH